MLLLLIFVITLAFSQQDTVWDTLTANIAVIEYQPLLNGTSSTEKFLANVDAYTKVLDDLKDETLDLVVFPESTLLTDRETAMDVKLYDVWNQTSDEVRKNLLDLFAYMAASHSTYLVVNLMEREECGESDGGKNCKNYGYRYYNTDVVFDRAGIPIYKYRKYNLFGEGDKDKPKTAEQVVIETDFGVKFGIFTCFDILFKSPAQDLLSQNIDGIIFPTMWFSELPFLTAMQAQQMWVHANDIAFLAAGANAPMVGSGGSGVYRGSKGLVLGGVETSGTKTFLYKSIQGEVEWQQPEDIDVLAKKMDNFYLLRDDSVDDYNSWIVVPGGSYTNRVCINLLTDDELCCNIDLKTTTRQPKPDSSVYTYQVVVFSGVRSFSGVYNGGIELCGITACLNSSLSSCGSRFPNYDKVDWPVTFEEITISADFRKSENRTQFPNSLLSSIRPIDATKTVWKSEEVEKNGRSVMRRTWSTTEKQDRLLTFAIYGRDFGKDSAPPDDDDDDGNDDKPGAANRVEIVSFWLLLCCSLLLPKLVMK